MRSHNEVRLSRRLAILALVTSAALTLSVAAARAAVEADVRGTVATESNAVGVGAGVLAPIGTSDRWYFNPNVEVGFASSAHLVSMNGDFHYDLQQDRSKSLWMGAGPAVLVTDRKIGNSTTDLGVNVLTGISGTNGTVRPYAQLKGVVADNSQIVLQGGIRF
jgi:hypothetical protein